MRKRNNVTLLRKKWRQSESNRPLSDLSTDLLMMSRNQLGKRATCPFILFIDNSSHMCYVVQFPGPPIITILSSLRYSRQNKSSSSTWCQSLSSLNRMVVRVNENFERRGECMDWELVVNDMWRGCLLSSRNSSNLQFLACSCLSKSKWCIWRIVALFHLCCHYEEILNYKHNIIPFASLRTQKRWVNIRWFLGPQQRVYIKNGNRTTQMASSLPNSLSLIACHFLSGPNTMLTPF